MGITDSDTKRRKGLEVRKRKKETYKDNGYPSSLRAPAVVPSV